MGSVLVMLLFILVLGFNGSVSCQRPNAVNIGAILTYDSVIGRVAKAAIEAAVVDINANSSVLGGTRLNLVMQNSECNVFLGSIRAFQIFQKDAVAIIGPQSSAIAHMISFISDGLHIPVISFAATDPTLSSLQFPYFLRSTQSDSYQMAAMADLIGYYEWKEVIAIFVDDDYGRNGIASLDDELAKKMSRIYYKIALPVGASNSNISDLLYKSKVIGPRVYVVHVSPDSGLTLFSIAQKLQMMTDEYAWLTTDWLFAAIDTSAPEYPNSMNFLQGVVGFRQHTPKSDQKRSFVSRWRDSRGKGEVSFGLNAYGLYAYDTVWAVAHAINQFLNEFGNITFSYSSKINVMEGKMQLKKLRTFDGGQQLFKKLLFLNFTGITGPFQFDSNHNLISGAFEVVNIDQSTVRTVGYWTDHSGLSETIHANKQRNVAEQYLGNVTWPGGRRTKPRGWVLSNSERPLRIGVPYRASYVEFVTKMNDTHDVRGYCIDVFNAALKLIPYHVPHILVPIGNGESNPNYDKLVNMVAQNVIEAAVGDIAIITNRAKIVDFTQPYIATGLVIVVPISNTKSSAWVFLRPFTAKMWYVTGAFFFMIGFVIWILEHRVNSDFRGPPQRQLITILLFSFSTLFNSQQEDTLSTLGRMVMMVWLFLLMVITSSFTASLTSFLTVQQLSSSIKGIETLIASNEPIGYQKGSFVRGYLTDFLNIPQSRLISLGSPEAYEAALQLGPKNGGVAAVVDELPYIELFLSKTTEFVIVGHMFTKSGWGFAFPRDSPLAVDMSTSILQLSENGELQRIHDKWFCKLNCIARGSSGSEPIQLHLSSFWALFLVCGIVTIVALLIFLLRAIRQFVRYKRKHRKNVSNSERSSTSCSQVVYSFFTFIDEKEEAIKNKFRQHENTGPQIG